MFLSKVIVVVNLDLEGDVRACHTGIINHAEESGFYGGNKWEME